MQSVAGFDSYVYLLLLYTVLPLTATAAVEYNMLLVARATNHPQHEEQPGMPFSSRPPPPAPFLTCHTYFHLLKSGSTKDTQNEIARTATDDTQAGGEGGKQRSTADAGNLIRALTGPEVSVALGVGLLLAVLANRIATTGLVDSQARTDILGVIASGGLITNGVYLLVRAGRGE